MTGRILTTTTIFLLSERSEPNSRAPEGRKIIAPGKLATFYVAWRRPGSTAPKIHSPLSPARHERGGGDGGEGVLGLSNGGGIKMPQASKATKTGKRFPRTVP